MANRMMRQFRYGFQAKPCDLFAKITIGASGAPTLVTAGGVSAGIKSITRNGAGDYTLTFSDGYKTFLFMDAMFQSASGIPAAPSVGLKGAPVPGTASGGTVRFVCSTAGGGAATDPGSGETMYLHLVLNDSDAL